MYINDDELYGYLTPTILKMYENFKITQDNIINVTTDGEYIYCDIDFKFYVDSVQIPITKYTKYLREEKIKRILNGQLP